MSAPQFTLAQLMDLLVEVVGLPDRHRTDRLDVDFADLGLDSVDFALVQLTLAERYQLTLPDECGRAFTLGEIVAALQPQIHRDLAA